jgi:hypothetical protein
MTDMQVAFWLIVIGALGMSSVFVAVFILFPSATDWHWMLKTSIAFSVCGLVVQCVRTLHYLQFGFYPPDEYFPSWATKDIGISMQIYYFTFIHPKLQPHENLNH